MATVTVTPESFSFVEFRNDEIVAAADRVRSQVGLDDRELHIDVDEESPLARVELLSLIHISEPTRRRDSSPMPSSA